MKTFGDMKNMCKIRRKILSVKNDLYDGIAITKVTYEAETRGIRERMGQMLDVMETGCQQNLRTVIRMHGVRNIRVMHKAGVREFPGDKMVRRCNKINLMSNFFETLLKQKS